MKRFITTGGMLVAALALFFGVVSFASAASFNDGSQGEDCPTVMVSRENNTPNDGYDCWNTSDTASDGDLIQFVVYYHNTSSAAANGVSIFLQNPGSGSQSSFTLNGGIKVNGTIVKQGSATISLDGPAKLVPVSAYNEYNGGANLQSISYSQVLGGGYNVGTLQPGWAQQGVTKVLFRVEGQGNNNNQTPSVITGGATVGNSSAQISGTVTSNGANVRTWFKWGQGSSTNNETSHVNRGNVNTSFQEMLTGLSNGTYSYQACAENADNTSLSSCGIVRQFIISNGNDNPVVQVPDVDTTSADPSQTSATLYGRINSLGGTNSISYHFRYGTNSGNLSQTTATNITSSTGTVSRNVSGLSQNTTYYYQLCGTNSAGSDCGTILSFTTTGGNYNPCDYYPYCNNNQNLEVDTTSATVSGTTAATLYGRVYQSGNSNYVSYYFKYGTSYGNLYQMSSSGSAYGNSSFNQYVTNLAPNTTYYYQACGSNGSTTDCGNILSFTTGYVYQDPCSVYPYCNNQPQNQLPTVSTLNVISRGGTYAVLDGYYTSNGCAVTTWFEYGTTQALGQTTTQFNRGVASGSMAQFISNLQANTTYFYRAVAQNCAGTARGNVNTFVTTADTVVPPTNVITRFVNVTTGGGGANLLRLAITNNQDTVARGEQLTYEVAWENISGRTLEDLLLEVTFQDELSIDRTRDGEIDRSGHAVIIEINRLDPGEQDDTEIDTTVRLGLRDGDPVVARAIMAFENPTTGSQENSIAYDSDEFNGSTGLGASLFGLGFLPNSLVGWLIILILLILIVVLARYYMNQGKVVTTVTTSAPAVPVQPQPAVSVTPPNPYNDYPPYRPTPKV